MHQHRHGRLAISSLRDADGVPVMSHNPSASHVKRAPESGSTCGPDDKTGPCERPASAVTESLPIILGVVYVTFLLPFQLSRFVSLFVVD